MGGLWTTTWREGALFERVMGKVVMKEHDGFDVGGLDQRTDAGASRSTALYSWKIRVYRSMRWASCLGHICTYIHHSSPVTKSVTMLIIPPPHVAYGSSRRLHRFSPFPADTDHC